MVLLISQSEQIAHYVPNWLLHIMFWSSSNKIFINVLWYVYYISRNKLFIMSIIPTNLTGSYIDYHVSRQMLCT